MSERPRQYPHRWPRQALHQRPRWSLHQDHPVADECASRGSPRRVISALPIRAVQRVWRYLFGSDIFQFLLTSIGLVRPPYTSNLTPSLIISFAFPTL